MHVIIHHVQYLISGSQLEAPFTTRCSGTKSLYTDCKWKEHDDDTEIVGLAKDYATIFISYV